MQQSLHRGNGETNAGEDQRTRQGYTTPPYPDSAVSEHAHETGHHPIWNEVKFIFRDPHWYALRVKDVIHVRLHLNNINRDSGIEIPEVWMPTIKISNSRRTVQ